MVTYFNLREHTTLYFYSTWKIHSWMNISLENVFSLEKVFLNFIFSFYFAHSCLWFLNISIWTIESGFASKLSRKCEDHLDRIYFSIYFEDVSPKHLIKNLLGTIRSFITLIYNFLLFFLLLSFFILFYVSISNVLQTTWVHKIKDFCMKFLNSTTETKTDVKKNESFEK